MKNTILSVIRHLLTIAGGVLVTKGILSESTVTQLVGALPGVIGLLWGAIDEYRAENAPKAE